MKKLYYARQIVDIMFLSDQKGRDLVSDAEEFLVEELNNVVDGRLSIIEVTQASEVPQSWRDAIVWGQDDDDDDGELTTIECLKKMASKKDPEYKTYLKLKKKFEGVDDE
jgi:hypothetical protein